MKILRKIFFYLVLFFSGLSKKYYNIVTKPKAISKEKTNKTLENLSKLAYLSVNFYKNKYSHLFNKDITTDKLVKELDITYKEELKKAGQEAVNNKYRKNLDKYSFKLNDSIWRNLYKLFFQKDFIFPMSTGGTSGTPLILYKNKNSILADALLFLRGWWMMGWRPGDKVLWFYNAYYDNNFSFINKLSPLTGIKLFFFKSLSDKVIDDFLKINNKFKPKIIVTFPSYIYDASLAISKNKTKLKHSPQAIEVSGETFFNHQRQKIEETWLCKTYDGYGALEFGMVAHECEHQLGMHIYEDVALLENSNLASNKSSIIVTRYDSTDMPIIRYQVGDLGEIYQQKCQCGLDGLVLKNVDGRIDDYIILPNKQRMYPSSFRIIINDCNQIYNNIILESQLTQNTKYELVLSIILSDKNKSDKISNYLNQEFKKHLPQDMVLKINFIDSLRNRKKFRFIERNYNPKD